MDGPAVVSLLLAEAVGPQAASGPTNLAVYDSFTESSTINLQDHAADTSPTSNPWVRAGTFDWVVTESTDRAQPDNLSEVAYAIDTNVDGGAQRILVDMFFDVRAADDRWTGLIFKSDGTNTSGHLLYLSPFDRGADIVWHVKPRVIWNDGNHIGSFGSAPIITDETLHTIDATLTAAGVLSVSVDGGSAATFDVAAADATYWSGIASNPGVGLGGYSADANAYADDFYAWTD